MSTGSPGGRPAHPKTPDKPPDPTQTSPPAADEVEDQTTRPVTAVDAGPTEGPARKRRRPTPGTRRAAALATTTSVRRRTNSRTSRTEQAIQVAIDQLVAHAPPLSPETRARLAELFSVTHSTRQRK